LVDKVRIVEESLDDAEVLEASVRWEGQTGCLGSEERKQRSCILTLGLLRNSVGGGDMGSKGVRLRRLSKRNSRNTLLEECTGRRSGMRMDS